MTNEAKLSESVIFARGEVNPPPFNQYFTGVCYVNELVSFDSPLGCLVSNVTFEPRCRNHWHIHTEGQILLVTGGRGWYQEEGKPARALHPGDVVEILPHVKHWHGAAADSWFVHVAIESDLTGGPPLWFEPVRDEEYNQLPSA